MTPQAPPAPLPHPAPLATEGPAAGNNAAQPPREQLAGLGAAQTTRRGLFKALGLGVGVAAARAVGGGRAALASDPLPPSAGGGALPEGVDPELFITHGLNPLTLETKRHLVGTSVITHDRHLFIRNNLPLPSPNILRAPDEWRLSVQGVRAPRDVTLAELKTLGLETVAMVLQCSGNGRAFYTHGPAGSNWTTGAAGCVVWSGVPLRAVLALLGGALPGARYLTSTGADPIPEGLKPLDVMVERSIPLEKALDDALLAWELNGAPISLAHGGPLRLIVPGYFGCNQIKYVRQISCTAEQTEAKIQKSGYRMRDIGLPGAPTQPSMWAMPIKSWLTNEEALPEGRQVLRGVAFGGERAVSRVEVSVDGGASWREASLVGPDLGRFAWRLFQLPAALPAGEHTLLCRAYDDQGRAQEEGRRENERGYGHSGWRDHALRVTVGEEARARRVSSSAAAAPAARAPLSAQASRGKEVFLKESAPPCGVCHTLDDAGTRGAVGPNLDALKPSRERVLAAVRQGLGAMPAQGQLSEEQLEALARYVFEATR